MDTQTMDTQTQEQTFLTHLTRVREIVETLENGQVDLESAAAIYREAVKHLTFCRERLNQVKNEIEHLNGQLEQADDFLQN